MYDLSHYGAMIADAPRLEAHAAALRRVVTSQSVVADIGAGTGIFTLLACRMGARRVYAIESSYAASVLREVVAENGCSDRVVCLHALSTEITLPERADVVIGDLRGSFPIYDHNIAGMIDARQRHLKPGGCLIPFRDDLKLAVVAAPAMARDLVGPGIAPQRLTLHAARRYATNTVHWTGRTDFELLAEPVTWFVLDYGTVQDARVSAETRVTVQREASGDGLIVWFDCLTAPGIGFQNGPGKRSMSVYNNAYLAWPETVPLLPGDVVQLALNADPVGDDYIWRWDTTISAADGAVRKRFRQSSLFATPLPDTLPYRSADHLPSLNEQGKVERFVLDRMDGQTTLADLAHRLRQAFPERFPSDKSALDAVADLSVRFSRRNGGAL